MGKAWHESKTISILVILIFITLTLFSCKQKEVSQIEVIKFDKGVLDQLRGNSDTIHSNFIGRSDLFTSEIYVNYKEHLLTKVFKDSLGNVVGLNKSKNGITIFGAEYFPNGQLMGRIRFKGGRIEGIATYYFSDGRIRSIGQWYDHGQIGTWKNYKENGDLNEVVYYDSSGRMIKTEVMK